MNKIHFQSGNDCWETPDELFGTYDSLFNFVLDAAANEHNHKGDIPYFGPGGIAPDALTASWFPYLQWGNVWLNPPYSRNLQADFVKKAQEEALASNSYSVVCLLPARTDTKLFHEVILPHADVTFLKGRVRFKGAAASAPFPSMIVIF